MPLLHISPDVTLMTTENPRFTRRVLHVTYRPATHRYPTKLKHGWEAFFVGYYGGGDDPRSVISYRKPGTKPVTS